jgi:hypothetical protein
MDSIPSNLTVKELEESGVIGRIILHINVTAT